jgi:glyoxylate reductase
METQTVRDEVRPAERDEAVDIVITQRFPEDVVAPYLGRFSLRQGRPGDQMSHADLVRRAAACGALVTCTADRVDAEVIAAAGRLRVIANVGVGYDHIDVAAAAQRGIWISNTPGVLTDSVADLSLLLLLATLRRAGEGFEHVRHGRWHRQRTAFLGTDPRDLTLGILGMGRIGQALTRRVASLGMHVCYHQRRPLPPALERDLGAEWVAFSDLLARADVLSIHVPLTPETRGLIGRDALAQVRPGVFLINTARGAIFDEPALIDALDRGHVAGVGLDVTATEPDVPVALREHPRAFILPHVGSATQRTRTAMMRLALQNAVAVLDGTPPPNAVDESRVYNKVRQSAALAGRSVDADAAIGGKR